jgi:hypothetical protein
MAPAPGTDAVGAQDLYIMSQDLYEIYLYRIAAMMA